MKPLIFVTAALLGNVALAWGAHQLALPLYLDSLFTFLVVRRLGFWAGGAVALGTNGLLAVFDVVPFPFVLCHLLTAAGAWLLFSHRNPTLPRYLSAGLASAVSNGILGSFISFYAFRGLTMTGQVDSLVLGLVVTGQSMLTAVFWGGMATNTVDKLLCAGLAFLADQRISPSFFAKAKSS